MASKPLNWSDLEKRLASLCKRLKMKNVEATDILGLAALGLRLAMDQPEFKAGKRGPKLALQPIDIWVLKYALTERSTLARTSCPRCGRWSATLSKRAFLTRAVPAPRNRKRLERLHKEIGDEITPYRAGRVQQANGGCPNEACNGTDRDVITRRI